MHMCARHIDNLLVVLGVAAVAGYSMIVDGHCGQHLQLACMKFFAGKGRGGGRLANLKVKFRRT